MTKRNACLVVLAAVAATALGAPGAGAGLGPDFQRCGKISDEGGRSPVKAADVRCRRARKVAKAFVQDDELKGDWKTYNPAGCEFFMYRKGHKKELQDWFLGDRGSLEIKAIYTVKTRGCMS